MAFIQFHSVGPKTSLTGPTAAEFQQGEPFEVEAFAIVGVLDNGNSTATVLFIDGALVTFEDYDAVLDLIYGEGIPDQATYGPVLDNSVLSFRLYGSPNRITGQVLAGPRGCMNIGTISLIRQDPNGAVLITSYFTTVRALGTYAQFDDVIGGSFLTVPIIKQNLISGDVALLSGAAVSVTPFGDGHSKVSYIGGGSILCEGTPAQVAIILED